MEVFLQVFKKIVKVQLLVFYKNFKNIILIFINYRGLFSFICFYILFKDLQLGCRNLKDEYKIGLWEIRFF